MRALAHSIPLLALLGLTPGASSAADPLAQRVDRLERRANVISKLVLQIQRLAREVQQQQGRIDSLQYRLKQQEKRNRDLYQDLDRRLNRRAPPATIAPAPLDPPAASSSPADEQGGQPPAAIPPSRDTARSESGRPVTPVARPGPAPSDAESAYQHAFDLLRQRDYTRAAEAFRGFLQHYPDAPLAENAWYWLGESQYAQNEYPQALKAFARVIEKYPFGTKVPGALLKTGFIHAADGDLAKARAALNRVVDEYPSSAVALLARKKLVQLRH